MRKKWSIAFILVTILLNFTACYILQWGIRLQYTYERALYKNDYTPYMRAIDNLNITLKQVPILAYISIGIALGIVFMVCWDWVKGDD